MSFAVLTDTSGNLPSSLVRERKLGVIPFPYFFEGKEHTCLDSESFSGDDFYARIKGGLAERIYRMKRIVYAESKISSSRTDVRI